MTLRELEKMLLNSQRLLLQDEDKNELYRGYVGNFVHAEADRDAEVVQIALDTQIFLKQKREEQIKRLEKQVVEPDQVTDFRFQDLEILIYQRVVIKNAQKK